MNTVFADSRGSIELILPSCNIGSVSRIISNAESFRARHYHNDDYHYCYVNYGEIHYYELSYEDYYDNKFSSSLFFDKIRYTLVKTGEIIYTAPTVLHEMYFDTYTSFDCYSKHARDQKSYEEDVIRFNFSLREIYNYTKK